MNLTFMIRRQNAVRGFALIEALIAVVVLATGLLALTALQGALMRSSADSKARSQMAAYAAGALDGLRSGGTLATATANAATCNATTGLPAIDCAAKAAGLSTLGQTVTTVPYYADATGNFTTTQPAATTPVSFNRVTLAISWTDATGGARQMTFTSDLSPLALTSSSVLVDRPAPGTLGLRPIVRRQTPVTEGMIPIALGNGEDTAATNPKPELVGSTNNSYAADTRFDVLTYNASAGEINGFVRFDTQVQTAFVGCKCTMGQGGFPTGGSNDNVNALLKAQAYRPSYWDGTQYSDPEVASGSVVRSPDPNASQSELCDVCCRDHRDPAGVSGPKFNPWIATHDHYLDPNGSAVAENGSGTFLEACRVIRVNGLWRVTPDPRVEDVAMLSTKRYPETLGSSTAPNNNNRATQPLISDTAKTSYVNYAYAFLQQKFYNKTTVNRLNLQASSGLNAPDYVPIGTTDTNDYDGDGSRTDADVRWLHARGLLADYLEPDAVTRIDKAITDCTGTTTQTQAQCVIPYLPIASINVTELANWAGRQTSEIGLDVSGLTGSTLNFAQAMINRFASAIARVGFINPADDDDPVKDEQTFALVPGLSKSGTWLKLANPSGTVFGDPLNPVRGFATVAGPVNFSVVLSGIPGTRDAQLSIKPSVEVGTTGASPCNPNSANNSNPYACTGDSWTGVVLAIGQYNRAPTKTNANTSVCNVSTKQNVCLKYTFNSATVDGAAVSPTYTPVPGTQGLPGEKGILSSLNVKDTTSPGYPSTVTLLFTESSTNATAVCNASGTGVAGWTCP